MVLGQTDNSNTGRNAGDSVNASSLQYPSGVWTNGKKLIVADAWNHRVLIWHSMPTKNGQPADVVLGQMDFESNQPNIMGLGKIPTAHTLYWPYGVFSDGNHLWVADTGNRRVLFYNKIPEANFAGGWPGGAGHYLIKTTIIIMLFGHILKNKHKWLYGNYDTHIS